MRLMAVTHQLLGPEALRPCWHACQVWAGALLHAVQHFAEVVVGSAGAPADGPAWMPGALGAVL